MTDVIRKESNRGEFIQTSAAAVSGNPLSQSIRVGEWLFLSGQLGMYAPDDHPAKGRVEGGPVAEAKKIMENISAVLLEGGASMDSVVKTTIFLTPNVSPEEAKEINAVYRSYFTEPYPARSLVVVANLNKGCSIEIECIASVT